MAEYIWFDKDGNEIRRENKGRGRPRLDAVQQPDGNWHIHNAAPPTLVKSVVIEESPAPTDDTIPVNIYSEVGRQAKVFNNSLPVDKVSFIKAVFHNPKDRTEDDGEVDIRKVVIQKDLGITGITFGAVYSRLLIKKDGSVYIWSNNGGDVSYIVHNVTKTAV